MSDLNITKKHSGNLWTSTSQATWYFKSRRFFDHK